MPEAPETRPNQRSAEEVEETRQEVAGAFRISVTMWVVLAALVSAVSAVTGVWVATAAAVIVASTRIWRMYACYRMTLNSNARSEGLAYTPEALVSGGHAKLMCKELCERMEVAMPAFSYGAAGFTGEYDPNTSTIKMGRALGAYEGQEALATCLHESAHHILLSPPTQGHLRRRILLEAAGVADRAFVLLALLVVVCLVFTGSDITPLTSALIICQLFRAAAVTTSEYEANSYAGWLLDQGFDELSGITSPEEAMQSLKLGEKTYTADLAGWMGLALLWMVLIMMA